MKRSGLRPRGTWCAFGLLVVALGGAPATATAKSADDLPAVADKVKGYQLAEGFFRVYRKKHRILAEIPRKMMNRPFLLTTSFAGGSKLAGFQWTDMLVQWERLDKKLLLIEKNVQYRAKKGAPIAEVVRRTYSDRLVKAMPILAEARSGSPKRGVLIDLTGLFAKNARAFFGSRGADLDPSVTKVQKLKSFPKNLEVAITMPRRKNGNMVTLHYSLVSLPSSGYKTREADERIGYFLTALKDFSKKGTDDRFVRYINRWRLEKKDPKLKFSPPKKPIVFYIERTVPIRYRRWVKAGILEWNKVYRKIGFVDAVVVYDHELFPDRDPEDARYSFFRWITSDRGFAMGPSRVNPLTGEIFDADIIFDDAMVRSYLREYELMIKKTPGTFYGRRSLELFSKDPFWHPFYGTPFASSQDELNKLAAEGGQQGYAADRLRGLCGLGEGIAHELARADLALLAAGKKGPTDTWPEDFIGYMVKDVVMHEVGHTLGLRHNFVASTWRTLDEIATLGPEESMMGSVMDYDPVFVLPPGQKQKSYTSGTVGPYDYAAIAYGYKPVKSNKELKAIAERIAEAGLDYATDEDVGTGDPYVMRWDMGSDPLAYAAQRLDLVEKLLPTLKDKVVTKGKGYARLRQAVFSLIYDVHFAGQVADRFVGGERYHRDHAGDPNARPPIEVVPAAKQREAMKLISDRILAGTSYELGPDLLSLLGQERWWHWGKDPKDPTFSYHNLLYSVRRSVLMGLLDADRLDRIYDHQQKAPVTETAPYTLAEHFRTLSDAIFGELTGPQKESYSARAPFVSLSRRSLQRVWVDALVKLGVKNAKLGPPITRALARRELLHLQKRLLDSSGAWSTADVESAAHLDETTERVRRALKPSFTE